MATTSTIAIQHEDGTVEQISCHWDGYPEHNGKLLLTYWTDPSKISEIMNLGNLSELGQMIGEKQDFNSPNQAWCLAYGRDRNESDTQSLKFANLDEYLIEGTIGDYNYIFIKGQWLVFSRRKEKMQSLTDVLNILAVESLK